MLVSIPCSHALERKGITKRQRCLWTGSGQISREMCPACLERVRASRQPAGGSECRRGRPAGEQGLKDTSGLYSLASPSEHACSSPAWDRDDDRRLTDRETLPALVITRLSEQAMVRHARHTCGVRTKRMDPAHRPFVGERCAWGASLQSRRDTTGYAVWVREAAMASFTFVRPVGPIVGTVAESRRSPAPRSQPAHHADRTADAPSAARSNWS